MKAQVDFKLGYNKAMQNAEAHLKAAELIAAEINYGIANSHLILASEEAVKAYMCYARFYDPSVEIKDFDKYFKDHKLKHKAVKDMFFFMNFIKEATKKVLLPFKEILKSKKDISTKELIKKKDEGYENLISWLETIPEIDHNEKWWNNANTNKNIGFYVNLNNNKWKSPDEISKEEYEESLRIVSEVLDFMKMIPQIETNKRSQELYNKIKTIQEGKSQ